MEYYNKVIESVQVRFLKGSNYKIEKPVTVTNYQENENTLLLLHHGSLKFGDDQELAREVCRRDNPEEVRQPDTSRALLQRCL